MPDLLPVYYERMSERELDFLRDKERKERGQFLRVVRILLAFCVAAILLFAWHRLFGIAPAHPVSLMVYFGGSLLLLLFACFCIYVNYRATLFRLQHDLQTRQKVIEQAHITRKMYMPQNDTYFFYLNSPHRLSIEVSRDYYESLHIGDEVNIEYTRRAKLYLGYF